MKKFNENVSLIARLRRKILPLGNIFSPACCRDKQAAGQPCVPKDNGIDCTSGTCNNLIPQFCFFGICWNFGVFNPLGGTCA